MSTFALGMRYTRSQINAALGGGVQAYLPTKDGRVVCGTFRLNTNPDAPRVVLPGFGPRSRGLLRSLPLKRSASQSLSSGLPTRGNSLATIASRGYRGTPTKSRRWPPRQDAPAQCRWCCTCRNASRPRADGSRSQDKPLPRLVISLPPARSKDTYRLMEASGVCSCPYTIGDPFRVDVGDPWDQPFATDAISAAIT